MPDRLAPLVAVVAIVAVIGCGRQAIAPAVPTTVTLSGPIGCGHSSFHVVNSCVPALQTADGTVYVVEAPDADRRTLMAARMRGGTLTVTGKVSVVNGVPTVTVESWQLTP